VLQAEAGKGSGGGEIGGATRNVRVYRQPGKEEGGGGEGGGEEKEGERKRGREAELNTL